MNKYNGKVTYHDMKRVCKICIIYGKLQKRISSIFHEQSEKLKLLLHHQRTTMIICSACKKSIEVLLFCIHLHLSLHVCIFSSKIFILTRFSRELKYICPSAFCFTKLQMKKSNKWSKLAK